MGEESPKNKVKFLCSYGGKVLPRPSDGILKYIGGETRVICVPRDVTFSELMKKVSGIVDIGEVVLKYQLVPEDIDTLVAVRTQEDVKHMMEELDGHGSAGSPMLRAFLFPKKPLLVDNNNLHGPPTEPYWLEQRYIDAINGIIRTSPSPRGAYSACCSPKSNSPDAQTTTIDSPFHPSSHSLNQNHNHNHNRTGHLTMPKVHSSPNLSNLTSTSCNNIQPHRDHHAIAHHHHPFHYPPSPTSSFLPRQDPQIGGGMGIGGRVPPITIDRGGGGGGGFNYYYSTATRQHKPCGYHEESVAPYNANGSNGGGHVMMERVHSVPRSRSPRNSIWE